MDHHHHHPPPPPPLPLPPCVGFTARSVPCGSLEEMALTCCTLTSGFGCKTEYGTVTPDVFFDGLSCPSVSEEGGEASSPLVSVMKLWEVSTTGLRAEKKTKGEVGEGGEARKEASIPLKCTDNWNPMGCSRSACCDGWIVGPLLPCRRDHKLKKQPCCACGPYSDFCCHYKSRGQLKERGGDQPEESEQCLASLLISTYNH